jgi:hypothetical protein
MKMVSKETKRWLRALGIAKILFEDQGYHSIYLEEIENFIRRKTMYSPKIREDLIPEIYRAAKALGLRMTTFVNQILERVLNEVSVFEDQETASDGNALASQEKLENALNQLKDEIRSSLISEGKEATIIGEFKIFLSKRAKLRCRVINGDPKRVGSIVYPMMAKRLKVLNGGDEIEPKETLSDCQESAISKEDVRDHKPT